LHRFQQSVRVRGIRSEGRFISSKEDSYGESDKISSLGDS
jgi:hypothetical protein